MAEKRAYNLRSGGSEAVTAPVQIEVSDENFMSRLLQCQQNTSQSGQVSDSDSGSENNSILSNESENEQTHGSESTSGDKQVPSSSNTCLQINADTVSQQAINLQILSQLGDISKRLNAIENKKPKKSSDSSKIKNKSKNKTAGTCTPVTLPPPQVAAQPLPNLQYLRGDAYIQAQVEQRLKNLVEENKSGTKIKSLRGGSVDVVVANRIKWPQEYVLAGARKERVQYDQLSMAQWVTGFCRIMKEEHDLQNRNSMLDYIIALFEDVQDFSWDSARASHAILLCRMEQGEVKNYTETDKLDRIRRANAQRHPAPSSASSNSKKQNQKTNRSMPCTYYNQGSCSYSRTHDTKGVTYKHICSSCFASGGKVYSHPENECRNKNRKHLSKNE